MVKLVIDLAFLAMVVGITVHATMAYIKSEETTWWAKLLSTSRDSATWLWSKVLLVAGMLLTGISGAAEFLNMPEVKDFVTTKIPVDYVGYALLGIAVVTFAARLRSMVSNG